MKILFLLLLPLTVSSAVITPRAPQGIGASIAKTLPRAKLVKVRSIPPRLNPSAKRVIATYGPYVLAGKEQPKPKSSLIGSLDPAGQAFLEIISDGLCSNCTVLSGGTRTVFEDGTVAGPAQGIYIHHIISIDISKPMNLPISKCGEGQTKNTKTSLGALGSEFLAQGGEGGGAVGNSSSIAGYGIPFGSSNSTYKSGFMLGSSDKVLNQVDLVNYNAESKNVFINYEIEYLDGHIGSDSAAVLMSVTGCEVKKGGIHLDKTGIADTESPKFPVTKNGMIVAAMGHMHDGGKAMVLKINGKEVCSSNAVYGKGGDIAGEKILYMSLCGQNIPIKKGDVLTMNSIYDLKSHPLRPGAEHNSMGMADVMGMFFLTMAVDGPSTTT